MTNTTTTNIFFVLIGSFAGDDPYYGDDCCEGYVKEGDDTVLLNENEDSMFQ